MKKLTIGYIGNFIPPYSTENDRKWSFLKLGHDVVTFQENQTTAKELKDWVSKLDLLIYSHTHDPSYVIEDLITVFGYYKGMGVPTASVHLDRWAWLKRVEDVGKEATWFTEYIFMADASPEAVELYNKHNLNWYYLKAGVVEKDCYLAEPDYEKYPHQIIFVGSKGYHPEYPFRAQLINELQKTYGKRFGHYGNDGLGVVRGGDLNTLYHTALIAVGDSCFGGRPFYVSDRYYETRGRGGFLLHPRVEGVDHKGVGFYKAGDLEDLKKMIQYYLDNPVERERMRFTGHIHVANEETYTQRSQEMLDIIFNQHEKIVST